MAQRGVGSSKLPSVHGIDAGGDSKYINAALGGLFKPAEFIHPFDDHYSLPSYLDQTALTASFAAADERAARLVGGRQGGEGVGFLSFIYMFFLLVHPFIDGNGRVARGLLDYYNSKLKLRLKSVWLKLNFKKGRIHKRAFQIFFRDEARLPPRVGRDPYPISSELRPHLGRMAEYMLLWAAKVAGGEAFDKQRPQVRYFSQLLRGSVAPLSPTI